MTPSIRRFVYERYSEIIQALLELNELRVDISKEIGERRRNRL